MLTRQAFPNLSIMIMNADNIKKVRIGSKDNSEINCLKKSINQFSVIILLP